MSQIPKEYVHCTPRIGDIIIRKWRSIDIENTLLRVERFDDHRIWDRRFDLSSHRFNSYFYGILLDSSYQLYDPEIHK